jgi:enoyl-CoA hydratase/carnithine racemase
LIDLATSDPADAELTIEAFQEAYTWWRRPDLITVAAVQGHAIGAGFQLALACDLRIAADDARFAMREISLGLVPDLGGTKPLTDLVGYGRALEICATGRWIEAAEAERIGLVNRVVAPEQLEQATQELVDELLANSHVAVGRAKRVLDASARPALAQSLEMEISVQEYCIAALRESAREQAEAQEPVAG